jgi:hypothetical protein
VRPWPTRRRGEPGPRIPVAIRASRAFVALSIGLCAPESPPRYPLFLGPELLVSLASSSAWPVLRQQSCSFATSESSKLAFTRCERKHSSLACKNEDLCPPRFAAANRPRRFSFDALDFVMILFQMTLVASLSFSMVRQAADAP